MAVARRDEGRDGSLDAYRAKRRFTKTPEPKGPNARGQGRLFTMQKHAARRLHYDLRLELDGVLKGEYVLIWDRGTWEPKGAPRAGLAQGKLVFKLQGERLSGEWALVRIRAKENEQRENWLLLKHADAAAAAERDVTAEHTTSVATRRAMDAIAANGAATPAAKPVRKATAALPAFVAPQLAQLVDEVPEAEGWLFEPKFDGYRAIIAASGDQVRIHTRNGHDWTHRFGCIAEALAALDLDGALLDGEITSSTPPGEPTSVRCSAASTRATAPRIRSSPSIFWRRAAPLLGRCRWLSVKGGSSGFWQAPGAAAGATPITSSAMVPPWARPSVRPVSRA